MNTLLWFHCITPLHNGSGEGLGALDRPILREKTTGSPYIQGSTIKGTLLAKARAVPGRPRDDALTKQCFGDGGTTGNRACISITDAQIVFFPVRSLVGVCAWVTSPLALARLQRWLHLCNPTDLATAVDSLLGGLTGEQTGQALGGTADNVLRMNGTGPYCLENLVLSPAGSPDQRAKVAELSGKVAGLLFENSETVLKGFFIPRLLLVSDEDFSFLTKRGTVVEANIRISDKGVTETGSLRYTEFLPAESVCVSFAAIEELGGGDAVKAEERLFETLGSSDKKPIGALQFGGDESKGKGLVRTAVWRQAK